MSHQRLEVKTKKYIFLFGLRTLREQFKVGLYET